MDNASRQLAKARAIKARLQYGLGTTTNIDIFKKFKNEKNYTIVFMPFEDGIDGFSNRKKDHFIIIINSNNTIGRNNFTCAHELYHLLFEYTNDEYIPNANSEEMANVFASYFLIPEDALYLFLQNTGLISKQNLALEDIVCMEDYFMVSRPAMLIRLKDEGLINQGEFDKYNKNVLSSVKKYGGNIDNHVIESTSNKYTHGEYNVMAKKLLEENKISNGKYEEYMIDAFNAKEIFGDVEVE